MGLVDGLVLGVLGTSMAVSSVRGLVREILGLLSWCLMGFSLLLFWGPLALQLEAFELHSPINWIFSALVIFLGIWFATRGMSSLMHAAFRRLGMGWLDHFFGALFGLIRGGLLAWLLIWVFTLVLGPDHLALTQAYTPAYVSGWHEYLEHHDVQKVIAQWDKIKDLDASWLSSVVSKEDIAAILDVDPKGA